MGLCTSACACLECWPDLDSIVGLCQLVLGMASKPQARPVPPKPKQPTEAELRARNKQQENLGDSCQKILFADINQPFSSVADAVTRLLPFHVFSAYEAEEADMEEVEGSPGAGYLVSSRADAWEDLCLRKTVELSNKAESIRARVEATESKVKEDETSSMDLYLMESLLAGEAKKALAEERQRSGMLAYK